jgi:hypothetical protein
MSARRLQPAELTADRNGNDHAGWRRARPSLGVAQPGGLEQGGELGLGEHRFGAGHDVGLVEHHRAQARVAPRDRGHQVAVPAAHIDQPAHV